MTSEEKLAEIRVLVESADARLDDEHRDRQLLLEDLIGDITTVLDQE